MRVLSPTATVSNTAWPSLALPLPPARDPSALATCHEDSICAVQTPLDGDVKVKNSTELGDSASPHKTTRSRSTGNDYLSGGCHTTSSTSNTSTNSRNRHSSIVRDNVQQVAVRWVASANGSPHTMLPREAPMGAPLPVVPPPPPRPRKVYGSPLTAAAAATASWRPQQYRKPCSGHGGLAGGPGVLSVTHSPAAAIARTSTQPNGIRHESSRKRSQSPLQEGPGAGQPGDPQGALQEVPGLPTGLLEPQQLNMHKPSRPSPTQITQVPVIPSPAGLAEDRKPVESLPEVSPTRAVTAAASTNTIIPTAITTGNRSSTAAPRAFPATLDTMDTPTSTATTTATAISIAATSAAVNSTKRPKQATAVPAPPAVTAIRPCRCWQARLCVNSPCSIDHLCDTRAKLRWAGLFRDAGCLGSHGQTPAPGPPVLPSVPCMPQVALAEDVLAGMRPAMASIAFIEGERQGSTASSSAALDLPASTFGSPAAATGGASSPPITQPCGPPGQAITCKCLELGLCGNVPCSMPGLCSTRIKMRQAGLYSDPVTATAVLGWRPGGALAAASSGDNSNDNNTGMRKTSEGSEASGKLEDVPVLPLMPEFWFKAAWLVCAEAPHAAWWCPLLAGSSSLIDEKQPTKFAVERISNLDVKHQLEIDPKKPLKFNPKRRLKVESKQSLKVGPQAAGGTAVNHVTAAADQPTAVCLVRTVSSQTDGGSGLSSGETEPKLNRQPSGLACVPRMDNAAMTSGRNGSGSDLAMSSESYESQKAVGVAGGNLRAVMPPQRPRLVSSALGATAAAKDGVDGANSVVVIMVVTGVNDPSGGVPKEVLEEVEAAAAALVRDGDPREEVDVRGRRPAQQHTKSYMSFARSLPDLKLGELHSADSNGGADVWWVQYNAAFAPIAEASGNLGPSGTLSSPRSKAGPRVPCGGGEDGEDDEEPLRPVKTMLIPALTWAPMPERPALPSRLRLTKTY